MSYGHCAVQPANDVLMAMYYSPQPHNDGLISFRYPLYEASDDELNYFLGSLASSVGKAAGGVAKTVGGVAKTAGKALSTIEKVIPAPILTAGLNFTPMGLAVRAGMGALTAAADGKNVFQSAMRSLAGDPVTRFYIDTGMAAARGENLLKAAQKAAQAGIGDLRQSLQFAAMVAPFVPGIGTGVAAALGAANALAAGQPITDALIAAARSAVPGGAVAQMAFDTAMNIAKGKKFSDSLLNSARAQLPGGPAAQAAFDAALTLAKGKSIQDAAFAATGRLLPPSPYAADALTFVKRVTSGQNIQKAALSALGNVVMSRIEQQTGPLTKNLQSHLPFLGDTFRTPAIHAPKRLPLNLRNVPHEFHPTPNLWLPSPANLSEEWETGSTSKAVRITIVGHASARWRGAKTAAQASRLNEILSNKRADNIRSMVEQILKREIPGVTISAGTSLAPGVSPSGIQVGSYGVGSRDPLVDSGKPDPNENNPSNRSVVLLLEQITTTYSSAGVSRAPLRVGARTKFWYGKVLNLNGAGLAVFGYFLRLAIRNPLSNKVVNYSGYLLGGGASSSKWSLSRGKPGSVGDEFSFYTDKEMGFDDFDKQLVRMERVVGSLGIKASVGYLTFVSLGKGASLLAFQKSFGLGAPRLEGAVVSGALHMEGKNPGDWFEVDGGTDTVPVATDRKQNDGLMLTFPTGKAGVNDLSADERRKLENFVANWARQVR
jgi:hypothetical protein